MILGFFATDISAWGAFLTGASAVIAVCLTLRSAKHKSDDTCDKRIELMREAFRVGTKYELRE